MLFASDVKCFIQYEVEKYKSNFEKVNDSTKMKKGHLLGKHGKHCEHCDQPQNGKEIFVFTRFI